MPTMSATDAHVRVLTNSAAFAYLGRDGVHRHVDANVEVDLPADVAREVVACGRAKYINVDDVPSDMAKAGTFAASAADTRAARERRAHADRVAGNAS